MCLTIYAGGGFHTELIIIMNWLKANPTKKLLLRLVVFNYHIDEIIEKNKNCDVLKYDENDENKPRSLCFLSIYLQLLIMNEVLKLINKNVTIEVHTNDNELKDVNNFSHYDFSFDCDDDCSRIFDYYVKTVKNDHDCFFIATNSFFGGISINHNKNIYVLNFINIIPILFGILRTFIINIFQ